MYSMFNDTIPIQYEEDLDNKESKNFLKILVKELNFSKVVKSKRNQKT